MVELYIHFPIRLRGLVLNELGTGTTLPFLPYISIHKVFVCSFISVMSREDTFMFKTAFIDRLISSFSRDGLSYSALYYKPVQRVVSRALCPTR
jgi:hypothetical protein